MAKVVYPGKISTQNHGIFSKIPGITKDKYLGYTKFLVGKIV